MNTRQVGRFVGSAVVRGALVVAPIYLAILLLFKTGETVAVLVQPFSALLPAWFLAERALSLLVALVFFFLIGVAVRTRAGRRAREKLQKSLFDRLPGYALFRSLTQQLADRSDDSTWKPALVELEDALVPAFIIEEVDGGRYTVFVPSAPTPFAGTVYVLDAARVHPLQVPFTQAIKTVSQWGSGAKDLVAAMQAEPAPKEVRADRGVG